MSRVLLAWEYGSGMGHVAILLPLAKALHAAGYEVVFALRETKALPPGTGFPVHQAPYIPARAPQPGTITHTLGDVFWQAGLNHEKPLLALADAWQSLIKKIEPDLVINEFAPTLALVTQGVIPTVTVGTGYSIPPADRPLPNIRFWKKELTLESLLRERELLKTLAVVRQSLGLPPLQHFSDMFKGEAQFVCTYPVLDCYRNYRQQPAIGPMNEALYRQDISLYSYREPRAFAYLNATLANLPVIVEGIKQSGLYCEAYIRGLAEEKRQEFADSSFKIHTAPQALHDILPYISVFIHHGGISSSEMCLRYGTPQLILANHLEQRVTGSALFQLGVAKLLVPNRCSEPAMVTESIKELKNNASFRHQARDVAKKLADYYVKNPVDLVVERCIEQTPLKVL